MSRYDITQTNRAVERLIEITDNPRHRYLLHAYNRHRYRKWPAATRRSSPRT